MDTLTTINMNYTLVPQIKYTDVAFFIQNRENKISGNLHCTDVSIQSLSVQKMYFVLYVHRHHHCHHLIIIIIIIITVISKIMFSATHPYPQLLD